MDKPAKLLPEKLDGLMEELECHAANDLFEHSLPREQPASPWGRPELF